MKKIILLTLLFMGFGHATKYEVVHIKRGGTLNVRDTPYVGQSAVVGKLTSYTTGITIKECTELQNGREWCYVTVPRGGSHIEGWVSSYYLLPMKNISNVSRVHIQNFLHNFYMADEENFLDKLKVFYTFPMQQYMHQKHVTLMNLRASKVSFYKYWPKRIYRLGYMKILRQKRDYTDVQVTVHWQYESHNDSRSGRDVYKVRIVKEDEQFKVLAIKRLRQVVNPKIIEENIAKPVILESNKSIILNADTKELTNISKKYYVKVGSFIKEPKAEYLNKIVSFGFKYKIEKVIQEDKIIRRVYIGPFSTTVETMEALDRIRKKINKNAYIQTNL